MDVKNNFMSAKDNSNLLGCIVDAITGNFLLSQTVLSRADASRLLFNSGINSVISKNKISGNELISEILPKLDYKGKTKGGDVFSINKGKIEPGIVDENVFGVENGELLKHIDKEYGRSVAIDVLEKSFSLGTRYLSDHGFTISLNDLNVNDKVRKFTDEIIKEAEEKTNEIIRKYDDETLEIIPGKTAEETREIKILQTLNGIRTKIGKIVSKEVDKNNPISIMMDSGSGGSVLNITQMACCVGQQALWAKRIGIGFSNRTLSFFKEHDLSPRAKGFIYSSFITGLKPYEFFFGAITGRDALMDTALRTPKSGYLYRRLVSALQDLRVEYDYTVCDASGNVVQFAFGGDGLDVAQMHLGGRVPPGEAVGVITAQSFGEASTQMVLNVFHSAGVAEMQVTLGLPRLIEIFDARKKPSTPLMEIYLEKEYNNEKDSRVIAEKIKESTVREIAKEIKIDFANKKIEIEVDSSSLKMVHAGVQTIVERLNEKGFSCKAKEMKVILSAEELGFRDLYKMKEKIKKTAISGVKGISQVVVAQRDKDYVIL